MRSSITAIGLSGVVAGKSFEIGSDPVTIGRNPDCSISLPTDPGVSRNHAQMYQQNGIPFIVDLGSSNGTRVNGEPLQVPTQLADQDVVSIGAQSFRIALVTARAPQPVTANTCIVCGSHQIVSVQSVAASGASSTVGTSVSVGGAHVLGGGPNLVGASIGASRSVSRTELAKMLAFPYPRPKVEKFTDTGTHVGAAVWIISSIVLAIPLAPMGLWWVAVIGGLVLGAFVSIVMQSQNKAKYASAEADHNRKQADADREYSAHKAVYDRSLYCPQCHSVFDPVSGRNTRPEQLCALL